MERVQIGGLKVAEVLSKFIEQEALPGTGVYVEEFWRGFETLITELMPKNQALLEQRERLQHQIDSWHLEHRGMQHDPRAYRAFLEQIGYLLPEPDDFTVSTSNVDPEIAQTAGPQLVVPVNNARYALNAANARWGSLYDALYGTDVIEESPGYERDITFNPSRGAKVFEYVSNFLDQAIPLHGASHSDVRRYRLVGSKSKRLVCHMADGSTVVLSDPSTFVGYREKASVLAALLFRHHGLHIEMQFDLGTPVCMRHPAGLCDVILESALTSIQDCEDSVAAVDAEDKVVVYRNWLGLMKGDLNVNFKKGYRHVERAMDPDREYLAPNGKPFSLKGRSLMMVRNVGHHMTSDAILNAAGEEIPEGIMDAVVTSLIALHDLKRVRQGNSREGSVYIVKPKMHGSEEVAFTVELFGMVENLLGLPHNTLKLGMMDEERRTSLNLKACIAAARERIIFINTGFLDRTGDEIHSGMEAGAMYPKQHMGKQDWLDAYEGNNVSVGLMTGLGAQGQIGKGMWAKPDEMFDMLISKIDHALAGASCSWVPSPTAATLHAIHYHMVDVREQQLKLSHSARSRIDSMLDMPVLSKNALSETEIVREIDNNVQSILGYIVHWIDQGIGCSKVPNINNVELMEDRATLRISSQHLANWLVHGICTEAQIHASLRRIVAKVDEQNAKDKSYCRISDDPENNLAFQAARELIFNGRKLPGGYTETVLHKYRRRAKMESRLPEELPLAAAQR